MTQRKSSQPVTLLVLLSDHAIGCVSRDLLPGLTKQQHERLAAGDVAAGGANAAEKESIDSGGGNGGSSSGGNRGSLAGSSEADKLIRGRDAVKPPPRVSDTLSPASTTPPSAPHHSMAQPEAPKHQPPLHSPQPPPLPDPQPQMEPSKEAALPPVALGALTVRNGRLGACTCVPLVGAKKVLHLRWGHLAELRCRLPTDGLCGEKWSRLLTPRMHAGVLVYGDVEPRWFDGVNGRVELSRWGLWPAAPFLVERTACRHAAVHSILAVCADVHVVHTCRLRVCICRS
eukprot:356778-Chlamydomonas_euryale.AAC.5